MLISFCFTPIYATHFWFYTARFWSNYRKKIFHFPLLQSLMRFGFHSRAKSPNVLSVTKNWHRKILMKGFIRRSNLDILGRSVFVNRVEEIHDWESRNGYRCNSLFSEWIIGQLLCRALKYDFVMKIYVIAWSNSIFRILLFSWKRMKFCICSIL